MAKLKVIRAHKTLVGSKITVEAKKDSEAFYGSLLGDRVFWLEKGERLTINVKGYDWRRGDTLSMSELVSVAWQWANIPWDWDYDL